MQQSYLILTDSGGIREEAPTLGNCSCDETQQRPEALNAGTVSLLEHSHVITSEVTSLLENSNLYNEIGSQNPYGDARLVKNFRIY